MKKLDQNMEDKFRNQGEMLANRCLKRFKHFKKRFNKQGIEVFRLYDWDIPEIRAAVDYYAGEIVIAEYIRKQSHPMWLSVVGEAIAEKFEIPIDKVHLKERRVGFMDGNRYERMGTKDEKMVVSERDLKFFVNLNDFVDTGLFSDHRNTRQMVRELSDGKDFLNLYCYTGAFTCYAASGGAKSTVSVDRSLTAIDWAKKNLELNGLGSDYNEFFRLPTFDFLRKAKDKDKRYDLAIVDPPSFSTSKDSRESFDISKDHPNLLKMVIDIMRDGATIFFSTNHQDFRPMMERLKVKSYKEITKSTIPEDYVSSKKDIHRCWRIEV